MLKTDVLIIGGGAAGLTAAISAARAGASVAILESNDRLGKKILATGNGRCNLSNTGISGDGDNGVDDGASDQSNDYNDPDFVAPILEAYPCEEICGFFEELGLLAYADSAGRVYPITNSASSVLNVLRLECARLGVKECTDFTATSVQRIEASGEFEVTSKSGDRAQGKAVIVTTGGGTALLGSFGHTIAGFTPVLTPLKTKTKHIQGLSGVRVTCAATLRNYSGELAYECGELLFRDYGVSGIMIFDLSRHLQKNSELAVDFFPEIELEDLADILKERKSQFADRTAETYFEGILHPKVATAILRRANVSANVAARELPTRMFAELLKEFTLQVVGLGDPKQAQVTRGGAATDEFNSQTLESSQVKGLFAAGETLDIDGRCGGYNLHWAWASGIAAGSQAAQFVNDSAQSGK